MRKTEIDEKADENIPDQVLSEVSDTTPDEALNPDLIESPRTASDVTSVSETGSETRYRTGC